MCCWLWLIFMPAKLPRFIKFRPLISAPRRSAPASLAPESSARNKSQPRSAAPVRSADVRSASRSRHSLKKIAFGQPGLSQIGKLQIAIPERHARHDHFSTEGVAEIHLVETRAAQIALLHFHREQIRPFDLTQRQITFQKSRASQVAERERTAGGRFVPRRENARVKFRIALRSDRVKRHR